MKVSLREAGTDHWVICSLSYSKRARIKGLWRETVALHHVAGFEALERAQERLLLNVQPDYIGNPSNMEKPIQDYS